MKWKDLVPSSSLDQYPRHILTLTTEKKMNLEILLIRWNSTVYALDEICPHSGGPLHLGDIEDLESGECGTI